MKERNERMQPTGLPNMRNRHCKVSVRVSDSKVAWEPGWIFTWSLKIEDMFMLRSRPDS